MISVNHTLSTPKGNNVVISHVDGIRLEIQGDKHAQYRIEFIDLANGVLAYRQEVNKTTDATHWMEPLIKYYIRWSVRIAEDDISLPLYMFDMRGKRAWIRFNSHALGDTIAWLPYAEEFRKKHQCEVQVETFHNALFEKVYPNLKFFPIDSGGAGEIYAGYVIGAFDNEYKRCKNNWRTIPLQQVASDILGLDRREVRPRIVRSEKGRPIPEKYIAIAEFSSFDCKQWLHPEGWQKVVNYLKGLGLQVMSVSTENTDLDVIRSNGRPIEETTRNIQHAEFFIGVSSGCSWLAWGLDVPVVMISGPTLPWHEMKESCYRVHNPTVCVGCMNEKDATFDRANRRLCPKNANFECSTSITPEMVIAQIEKLMRDRRERDAAAADIIRTMPQSTTRVLFITPHTSTGGLPQYLYHSVRDLNHAGAKVAVVEWEDNSGPYSVQKKRIQRICDFYSLGLDKQGELSAIIRDFAPTIIHFEEFPEYFVPDDIAHTIYHAETKWKYLILETSHTSHIFEKKWLPDRFAFVSNYHVEKYAHLNIPSSVAAYQADRHTRPDRTQALEKLGLDPGRQHVLNVGLFTPGKNQGEVFEAARQLPDVQFHFVGNQAPNFADYWQPLMENKPANCVIWGERDDVDSFYAACDLLYFSSTFELCPLVVKEALAWHMPVLMRYLLTYGMDYRDDPLVVWIEDDLAKTCRVLRHYLPSLGDSLSSAYKSSPQKVEYAKLSMIHVRPDKVEQDLNATREVIDQDCYDLERVRQMIPAPKFIMDIGGHIGSFAMRAAQIWPDAKVLAYEPHGVSANLYRENAKDRHIDATVETAAISYDPSFNCLTEDTYSTGGGILVSPEGLPAEKTFNHHSHVITIRDIRTETFEQALANSGQERIDLLKMDCETAEVDILRNMSAAAAARIGFIVGEYHIHGGFEEFQKLLKSRFPHFECVQVGKEHGGTMGIFMAGPRVLFSTASVAVVIANLNYAKTLRRAILSALDQSVRASEVIVVDGGSTDESEKIVRELSAISQDRVTWIGNGDGRCRARNVGILASKAEYIVPLDADDWIETAYIERCLAKMTDGVGIVSTRLVWPDGGMQEPSPPFTLDRFFQWNLTFCCSMFRRAAWEQVGGYDEDPEHFEDWALWGKMLAAGWQIEVVPEPLFHYEGRVGRDEFIAAVEPEYRARTVRKIKCFAAEREHKLLRDQVFDVLRHIEDPIVVELGAHVGEDTALLRHACQGVANYIAVEPDNRHYPALRQVNGIHPVPMAVASYTGEIEFHLSDNELRPEAICSSSIRQPKDHTAMRPDIKFERSVTVGCTTLDDLAICYGLHHIDLLWADIQGAEKDMVLGGKQILAKTDWIFLESYTWEMFEGQALRGELLEMLPEFELVGQNECDVLLRRKKF